MRTLKSIRDSHIGKKYKTKQGYIATILEYINKNNILIVFDDGVEVRCMFENLKRGSVKNPYHKSVYGIGFIGIGKYKSCKNGVKNTTYVTWSGMLRRCYNERERSKQESYKNCLVSKEWHNFQNYAEWYEKNYVEEFEMDKDILIKGNKIYSPETCCFIPQEINTIFGNREKSRGKYPIGVRLSGKKYHARLFKNKKYYHLGTFDTPEEAFQAYKVAKEVYIKEVADKWRKKIIDKVYQAMINFQINITD